MRRFFPGRNGWRRTGDRNTPSRASMVLRRLRSDRGVSLWRFSWAVIALFIVILAGLNVTAQKQTKEQITKERTLARGQKLFLHYCGPCHGPQGKGDGKFFATSLEPKPTDLTTDAHMKTHTDEELFRWIAEGSGPAGRSLLCPPWGKTLDEEQIRDIVRFVRTLPGKNNQSQKGFIIESPQGQMTTQ